MGDESVPLLGRLDEAATAHIERKERRGDQSLDVIFFFQAEDGIRDYEVTGVQTCALPILGDFSFYALDAMTGEKKWSYAAESKIAGSAVYEDGTAYIVTEKGLHALDTSTGKRKWLFETLQEIPVQQMNDVRRLGKRPAQGPERGENALFLTAWPFRMSTTPQKCFVYAVAPESGKTMWVNALDGLDITAPVVTKGLVFVTAEDPRSAPQPGNPLGSSSNQETLYAINAVDGQI